MILVVIGGAVITMGLIYGAMQVLNPGWLPVVSIAIGILGAYAIQAGLRRIGHIFQ